MKRKNKGKLHKLLAQIAEIVKDEKDDYLAVSFNGDCITMNNRYWDHQKAKKVHEFSEDRGKTWIDMR